METIKNEFNREMVNELFVSLLFQKDETKGRKQIPKLKIGEGLRVKYYKFFNKKIKARQEEIRKMLLLLSDKLRRDGDDGYSSWSFYEVSTVCVAKNGDEYYHFFESLEQLFAMGSALNLCKYDNSCPRAMWPLLKGGPNIFIKCKN